jgi:hypothetical protein
MRMGTVEYFRQVAGRELEPDLGGRITRLLRERREREMHRRCGIWCSRRKDSVCSDCKKEESNG